MQAPVCMCLSLSRPPTPALGEGMGYSLPSHACSIGILKLWYKSLFCRGGINCLSLQQPAELSQRLHVLALWQLQGVLGVASV